LETKKDLSEHRAVTTREAREFAETIGGMYYETSAKQNEGIEEVFMEISKKLLNICTDRLDKPVDPYDNDTVSIEHITTPPKNGTCC